MEELQGQGSDHADLHATFDHRLPLDAFHGNEADWPLHLGVWVAIALAIVVGVRWAVRSGRASWWLIPALLTLVPSVRDGGLAFAAIGLGLLWVGVSRLRALDGVAARAERAWERIAALPRARFGAGLFLVA